MIRFLALVLAVLGLALPVYGQGMVTLQIGQREIRAEVAATPAERNTGLMGRRSLPPNRGMLFVFPEPGDWKMWMKNTLLPLSAAFIDSQGKIVALAEMKPHTLSEHGADQPVLYVLEMPRRWFAEHAVKVGTRVAGLEQAGPAF